MRKIFLLGGILVSVAAAQPPTVIRVLRNAAIQPYLDSRAAVNVVGMSAISGRSGNRLIELHDSFGSLEDLDKALSAVGVPPGGDPLPDDAFPPPGTLIAVYRPGLSYRPDQAAQTLSKARYLDAMVSRIRPGTELEFAKLINLRAFGHDSINLDRPEIAYQVISGAPAGTYIFLAPLPSLRFLDDGRPATPVYAEGAEAAAKKIAVDTEIIREHLWFRIEPGMSYVSEQFASSDSAFWHPGSK